MVRAGIREAHPAGIWSDGSTDGPVIGTLVVVLDRAKNLPNKKKIGKQDPYAVARLAKVAKRTDTDVRGGQVPKWDKELRFPVRDSPDYKTLKISVFNDDKKVDLIGEVSIRLDKILVKGGGTDDGWRVLKCKDKYCGDILVELTFWDLRPKDEPAREKRASAPVTPVKEREEVGPRRVGGAREMGARPPTARRRPLPEHPTKSSRHAGEEKRATRRSRHAQADLPSGHRHTNSQPEPAPPAKSTRSRRSRHDLRHSTSRVFERSSNDLIMPPQGYEQAQHDVYDSYENDPYNFQPNYDYRNNYDPRNSYDPRNGYDPRDGFDPRNGMGREEYEDYERQDVRSRPPPPPTHYNSAPVIHQEPFPGGPPPMQHSLSSGPAEMQDMYQHDVHRQHTLRHFRSVPAFAQQDPEPRNNFEPRHMDRQMEVYGSSVPEQNYGYQPPMQQPMHPQPPMHHIPPVQQHMPPVQQGPPGPPPHQNALQRQMSDRDLPPIGYPPNIPPVEDDDDAPPPPPPPHRHATWAGSEPSSFTSPDPQTFNTPEPTPDPVFDEPNWDNHRPKSMMEEHGLPSYESVTKPPPATSTALVRRGSFCPPEELAHNGLQLPPSLVPGLDPVVADQLSDQIGEQQRRMSIYQGNGQVATRPPPSNYHRPQVEEVQDVQVCQSAFPSEEQVIQLELAQQQQQHQQEQQQLQQQHQQLQQQYQQQRQQFPPHHRSTDSLPSYNSIPEPTGPPPTLPSHQQLRHHPSIMEIPARKPLPSPAPTPQPVVGDMPFGPDSYDIINPAPAKAAEAIKAANAPVVTPGSTRVLDPTDILPVHTHAPEPERRAPRAPPPVPIQHRRERVGRRSLSPIPPPKGPRLSIEGTSPPKQVSFDASTVKKDRNKIRKSVKVTQSMGALTHEQPRSSRDRYSMSAATGGMVVYDPTSQRERERQYHRDQAERDARALVPVHANRDREYDHYPASTRSRRQSSGLELGLYGGGSARRELIGGRDMGSVAGRHRGAPQQQLAAPAVPPKVPISHGMVATDEAYRLSQEMSLISIGAGDGGRSYRGRG